MQWLRIYLLRFTHFFTFTHKTLFMRQLTVRFTLIFSTLLATNAEAQKIIGNLSDTSEKKLVHQAVVLLMSTPDSMLYKFTRTNKDGKFEFNAIKPGKYILQITHPFYGDYVDDVNVAEGTLNLNTISYTPKAKLLQEIIIKSGSPIRIKGDTVTYTADSFKVSANANVEELLKKLPGIQVDKNGKIKSLGSNKGAELTYLNKGDKVYTAQQSSLMFDNGLNEILTSNGISMPKVDISVDNSLTNAKLDKIAKAIENKDTLLVSRDIRGEKIFKVKNGTRQQMLNTRLKIGKFDV